MKWNTWNNEILIRKRGNKSNYFYSIPFIYCNTYCICYMDLNIDIVEWAIGQRETKREEESRRTEWRWRTAHAKRKFLQGGQVFPHSPPFPRVSSVHLMSMLTFCRLQFSLLKHTYTNTGMLTITLLVGFNILSSPVIVCVLSVSQTITSQSVSKNIYLLRKKGDIHIRS